MLKDKKKDVGKQVKEEAQALKAKATEDEKTNKANKKAKYIVEKERLKEAL